MQQEDINNVINKMNSDLANQYGQQVKEILNT